MSIAELAPPTVGSQQDAAWRASERYGHAAADESTAGLPIPAHRRLSWLPVRDMEVMDRWPWMCFSLAPLEQWPEEPGGSTGDGQTWLFADIMRILTVRVPPRPRRVAGSDEAPFLQALDWIQQTTGLADERIARLLGVSRQALHGWRRAAPMSAPHRQRLLAVRELLQRAARRHATPEQLVAWLKMPRGADGRTPAELIESGELDRARLYAISDPEHRLVRPPAWVRSRIPEAFRAGAEHRQEPVAPEPEDVVGLLADDDPPEDRGAR